jgi:hypothetical protein
VSLRNSARTGEEKISLMPGTQPLILPTEVSWFVCTSQSHIATDGQSVSQSWCQAPSGANGQILIIL